MVLFIHNRQAQAQGRWAALIHVTRSGVRVYGGDYSDMLDSVSPDNVVRWISPTVWSLLLRARLALPYEPWVSTHPEG